MPSLNCGHDGDYWVRHALACIPDDIREQHGDLLAFVSTTESDGRRLSPEFAAGKHIIVLSERVIPHGPVAEDHPLVRYLFFVVLHEVAHAVRDHRPPSGITPEQNQAQEEEANMLAFSWFNDYLVSNADSGLVPFTEAELEAMQQQMRQKMETALRGT